EEERDEEDETARLPRAPGLEAREPDPRAVAERRDLVGAVRRSLGQFEAVNPRLHRYAKAVLLDGRSGAEVAASFRVSLRTVQLAVKRARDGVAPGPDRSARYAEKTQEPCS